MSDSISLFNGHNLDGWVAVPRVYGTVYPGGPQLEEIDTKMPRNYNEKAAARPAEWTVEDGAIVGRQGADSPGWGGYLVSERTFGSFDLELEMNPDWPADTGVLVRRLWDSWEGLQILVDHRQSGSIGGFFGNGIASIHAVPFNVAVKLDESGNPIGLVEDDPATSQEPITDAKRALLLNSGTAEEFLAAWKWRGWNTLRIRCEGTPPHVTTWVNGLLVAEIDMAAVEWPDYDADEVWKLLGERGHIAFEVHDNDAGWGDGRWGLGAACRWRNIRVREL